MLLIKDNRIWLKGMLLVIKNSMPFYMCVRNVDVTPLSCAMNNMVLYSENIVNYYLNC